MNNVFHDIMIDLETLGTAPGCVILSLGAVAFDANMGVTGPEFYHVINRASAIEAGLTENPDTVAWWNEQSPAAQLVLEHANTRGVGLFDVLESFRAFTEVLGGLSNVRIWGNGADFDQPILSAAYQIIERPLPWKHWNSRCYRTLKGLEPDLKAIRSGTHHNALDDARTQALHACLLLQRLKASRQLLQDRLKDLGDAAPTVPA